MPNYLTNEQAIAKLKELTGKQYSDEQTEILNTSGGISIAAVAGSGKTTVLVALIAKRILTGEIDNPSKILCTTFSKAGATEVQARLSAITRPLGLPDVKVCTLHSICYSILLHFGIRPNILDESENSKLIVQAVGDVLGKHVFLEQDALEQLTNTISIMDNNLMTVNELITSGKYLLEYTPVQFQNIVDTYKRLKQNTGKHTFDDLLIGVYEWLCVAKHDIVINYCRENYKYLFLDEFQDTNKVQFKIIKVILGAGEPQLFPEQRLVVVGDDDQNVYEWRGTDPNIMINIRSVVDVTKRILSTNYRCKSNIVNSAMNCVRNMGTRQKKVMRANTDGGKVELLDTETITTSVQFKNDICKASQIVTDRILEDITTQKHGIIPNGHFCIMTRTNIEMSIVANMLMRRGIIVNLPTYSMKLSKSKAWTVIKNIVQLSKPFNGAYRMRGLLNNIVQFGTSQMEELINDISNSCQCSMDWAIEYMIRSWYSNPSALSIMILGDDKYAGRGLEAVTPKAKAKAEYVLNKFNNLSGLIQVINALRSEDRLGKLLTCWNNCYRDKSTRMTLATKEYICSVYQEQGQEGFEKFINLTEQIENKSEQYLGDARIELRTIHGSKGMEWNTVFILMDDNLSFPDFEKLQMLRSKYGVSIDALKKYVDSERRLHYVAQTRAKNELYYVCPRKQASVFLEEAYGYEYKPSNNALLRAQVQNLDCSDENGRIIYKALNNEYQATELSHDTLIE